MPISGMSRPPSSTSGLTRSLMNLFRILKKMNEVPKAHAKQTAAPINWAVN